MAGYESPDEFIESVKDIETSFMFIPKTGKKFLEIIEAKGFVEGLRLNFSKGQKHILGRHQCPNGQGINRGKSSIWKDS